MSEEAVERLRRQAQNEQTVIDLSRLLRIAEAENAKLRDLWNDAICALNEIAHDRDASATQLRFRAADAIIANNTALPL